MAEDSEPNQVPDSMSVEDEIDDILGMIGSQRYRLEKLRDRLKGNGFRRAILAYAIQCWLEITIESEKGLIVIGNLAAGLDEEEKPL